MSRPALRRPGSLVDPACPLDWSHPLNAGLVGEWAVVPNSGWRGGLTLRDLVRGGHNPHDGTLTNGPTWAGAKGRPGGFGAVNFDGTNDYAPAAGVAIGTSFTAACWVNLISAGAFCYALGFEATSDSGLRVEGTATPSMCDGVTTATSGTALPTGEWHHWLGTTDGSTLRIYVDGAEKANHAASRSAQVTDLCLAADRNGGQLYLNCLLDGAAVWNRVLTAAEVAALYAETRRGNPERWRWLGRRAWSVPVTAAATFNPGWATGATRGVLGTGVL